MSELEPLDDDILSIVAASKHVPELEAQRKAEIFATTTAKIGAGGPDGGGSGGGGGGTTGTALSLGKLALAATFVAGIVVGVVADRLVTKTESAMPMSVVTEHRTVAPALPSIAQPAPPAPVQPLDDCMKKGNVIDEAVANCRFGQLPRPAQGEPATGMVSADYMADFKANASRNSTRSSKPYSLATASIREADGRNRYRAQWRVYGNTIDGDSVCENFAIRSFERRECRKAAAVNFREECREWTKRAARNRDEDSKNAQQRYCEVTANFSP